MHTNELTSEVRRIFASEGFAKVRFAKAETLADEGQLLRQWLHEKRHAGMEWMNKGFEKRVSVSSLMEDARSVISLAYPYDTPYEHSESDDVPKISRYAWGTRDYHKIIKGKLRSACRQAESLQDGFRTRPYVDDGPVMDKAWAARSGLGRMGKHSNIIDRDLGSFFFIATVITNFELTPDKPVEDLCGDCRLCIVACPTGAIFEEYRVDANLCISYHTIENRDEEINGVDLNGWIFGCDVCQDVCPYNRPGHFSDDEHFIPNSRIFGKTYEELLAIGEKEFSEEFAGTPVMRTKYKGWRRNLIKARSERA